MKKKLVIVGLAAGIANLAFAAQHPNKKVAAPKPAPAPVPFAQCVPLANAIPISASGVKKNSLDVTVGKIPANGVDDDGRAYSSVRDELSVDSDSDGNFQVGSLAIRNPPVDRRQTTVLTTSGSPRTTINLKVFTYPGNDPEDQTADVGGTVQLSAAEVALLKLKANVGNDPRVCGVAIHFTYRDTRITGGRVYIYINDQITPYAVEAMYDQSTPKASDLQLVNYSEDTPPASDEKTASGLQAP